MWFNVKKVQLNVENEFIDTKFVNCNDPKLLDRHP